jgi:hypothetical protein
VVAETRGVARAELVFNVQASDADAGTTLTYTAEGLPEGATLSSATGEFRWTRARGRRAIISCA